MSFISGRWAEKIVVKPGTADKEALKTVCVNIQYIK
jgi:hypothetical protein